MFSCINTELKRKPKTLAPTRFRIVAKLQRQNNGNLECSLLHLNNKYSNENNISKKSFRPFRISPFGEEQ